MRNLDLFLSELIQIAMVMQNNIPDFILEHVYIDHLINMMTLRILIKSSHLLKQMYWIPGEFIKTPSFLRIMIKLILNKRQSPIFALHTCVLFIWCNNIAYAHSAQVHSWLVSNKMLTRGIWIASPALEAPLSFREVDCGRSKTTEIRRNSWNGVNNHLNVISQCLCCLYWNIWLI